MIDERSSGRTVTGNLAGQKIAMGIDDAAMAHIMNVLTDLYSDPELAVLREYSTNARDAHIEAGESRPIEVTLPSPLAPTLRVRDYGTGLDVSDLEAIYSRYGTSTKRGTNDQVGMLGLGCKSALTYSDQFTLVAVKDGARVQASVSRNAEGAGAFTIVDTSATDDPNGVEVTIPARRNNDMAAKAAEFFAYWDAGSVLVNGEAPDPVGGLRLSDRLLVAPFNAPPLLPPSPPPESARHRIVMGNVAYPATFDGVPIPRDRRLVAFVNIGEVHFTPSREALHDTPTTRATLEGLGAEYKRDLAAAAQGAIEGATTRAGAVAALAEWSALGVTGDAFKWNGEALPTKYDTYPSGESDPPGTPARIRLVRGAKGYSAMNDHRGTNSISVRDWSGTVFVLGFNLANFTADQRRKLDAWAESNTRPDQWALISANHLPRDVRPWIDPARIVKWEDIRAIRTGPAGGSLGPAAPGTPAHLRGAYDAWRRRAWTLTPADTIAAHSGPVYWTPLVSVRLTAYAGNRERERAQTNRNEAEYLTRHHSGALVVRLPANRVDKFRRDFPAAERAADTIAAEFKAWWRGIADTTKEGLRAAATSGEGLRAAAALDPRAIADPDLARVVRAAKGGSAVDRASERLAEFRAARVRDLPEFDQWAPESLDRYPLLEAAGPSDYRYRAGQRANIDLTDDLVLYVNAAYAARKEGK